MQGHDKVIKLAKLGPVLMANGFSTLRKIALHSQVRYRHKNVLFGLNDVLKDMAGSNTLEELELDISFNGIRDNMLAFNTDVGEFPLDGILSAKGAFPYLHRVSVELNWNDWEDSDFEGLDEENVQCAFYKIKPGHFVRLRNCPAIDFSFSEHIYDLM